MNLILILLEKLRSKVIYKTTAKVGNSIEILKQTEIHHIRYLDL